MGRKFIINNTFKMIRNNPSGIGLGNFKREYSLQQASFFKANGLDNRYAAVADNTEYALNEYLHISAELGVWTGILFILFNIFVILCAVRKCKSSNSSQILFGLIGCVGVLTGAHTFYLLHWWVSLLFYLFCLCMMILGLLNVRLKPAVIFLLVLPLVYFLTRGIKEQLQRNALLTNAVSLSVGGYQQYADSLFKGYHKKSDPRFLQELGNHQLRFIMPDSAIETLLMAKAKVTNSQLYVFLGEAYFQKKMFKEAEYYYKQAIYMVPNRFVSRYKLCLLYKTTQSPEKEIYWLNSIQNLPEKIPSATTKSIKEYANARLKFFVGIN